MQISEETFWSGGQNGELLIGWCVSCEAWRHPSLEFCPDCTAEIVEARPVSGKARVLAFTINHQQWMDCPPPPYVIAIVGLAEDESVRLTTNIVNCRAEDVRIGAQVRAAFERRGDVWIPLFELIPDAAPSPDPFQAPPKIHVRPRASQQKFEDKAAITGIGASKMGRRLGRSALALTVDACLGAIDDAGLDRGDIDGICAYPGSSGLPGISDGGVRAIEQALKLNPVWHNGGPETPGQTGAIVNAMLAVASGLCRHVLCFTSFSATGPAVRASANPKGDLAWALPYGCASPANWLAMYASHYCAKYRVDPDFLGWIAVTARAHAAKNPAAQFSAPIDLDVYRASRLISTPFRLLDCDAPCDGAMAIIVSAKDAAKDTRATPILIEAVGTQIGEPQFWDQAALTHQPQVFSAAAHLWSRTDCRTKDVDVALLYDGFTFNAVSWLEALGFCGLGEAVHFIDQGRGISLESGLPLNPHGGHLGEGRTQGYGQVLEAIRQLRGEAGDRQIKGARLAVTSSGGAIPAGCFLLRRD